MVAAHKTKVADKQEICKKVLTILKKKFPGAPQTQELPVLETMLFAVCLENTSVPAALDSYQRLLKAFHDLNEIRVSSMDELESVFQGQRNSEWRALRIRTVLQHVFETNYAFDFEGLKRKTLELASKQLAKIKPLSFFIRGYTLHEVLGAHVLPIDDRMHAVLVWLDLAPLDSTPEQASEGLHGAVRKAEGGEFCNLVRVLANETRLEPVFDPDNRPEEGSAIAALPPATRLDRLLKGELKIPNRSTKKLSRKLPNPAQETPHKKPPVKSVKKKAPEPPAKAPKPKADSRKVAPRSAGKAVKKVKVKPSVKVKANVKLNAKGESEREGQSERQRQGARQGEEIPRAAVSDVSIATVGGTGFASAIHKRRQSAVAKSPQTRALSTTALA